MSKFIVKSFSHMSRSLVLSFFAASILGYFRLSESWALDKACLHLIRLACSKPRVLPLKQCIRAKRMSHVFVSEGMRNACTLDHAHRARYTTLTCNVAYKQPHVSLVNMLYNNTKQTLSSASKPYQVPRTHSN